MWLREVSTTVAVVAPGSIVTAAPRSTTVNYSLWLFILKLASDAYLLRAFSNDC